MFKHFIAPTGVEVFQYLSRAYLIAQGPGEIERVTFIRVEVHAPAATVANVRVYKDVPVPQVTQGEYGQWNFRFAAGVEPVYQADLWGKTDFEALSSYLSLMERLTPEEHTAFHVYLSGLAKRFRLRFDRAAYYGLDGVVQAELSLQHRVLTTIGVRAEEIQNPSLYKPLLDVEKWDGKFHVPDREITERVDSAGMKFRTQRLERGVCLFFVSFDELSPGVNYGGSREVYKGAKGYFGVYFPDAKYRADKGSYRGCLVLRDEHNNHLIRTGSSEDYDRSVNLSYIAVVLYQLKKAGLLSSSDAADWSNFFINQEIWSADDVLQKMF